MQTVLSEPGLTADAVANDLTLLEALWLGILQGVAEFLPISSSGHLVLAQRWLGVEANQSSHAFNIVVHLGTLSAVLWVYRCDLKALLGSLRFLLRSRDSIAPEISEQHRWVLALGLATLPLALVLHPSVEAIALFAEAHVQAVGAALLFTALLIAFTHFRQRKSGGVQKITKWSTCLLVGFAQLIAVLPGVSRSGSTIAAALGLGVSRDDAARFSFLLSIPAILGAAAKETLDLLNEPFELDLAVFSVGFFSSAIVGLLSLRFLLGVIARVGLLPFVPYLLALGGAALILG